MLSALLVQKCSYRRLLSKFSIWWWWWWWWWKWVLFTEWLTDERRLRLISKQDHYERFSPLQISDTPQAELEPEQNLSSDFDEWSCTVVITTTSRRQFWMNLDTKAAVWRCSTEKPFRKISWYSHENSPLVELCFSKVAVKRPLTFIKLNSETSIFLEIFQDLHTSCFYVKKPLECCSCR